MDKNEMRKRTCCFTGHRSLPPERINEIASLTEREVRRLIEDDGVCFFGVGGALGFDTLAAELLFRLRGEYPHIRVILVYPFEGFTKVWPTEQREEFDKRLEKYDKVVCVCEKAGREAYLARNRKLVDGSAYCICYCERDNGGTAYTVRYAEKHGLEIVNICPLPGGDSSPKA